VRYRRGEIVHRLLQALPEIARERRAAAAARFVARPSFGVPEGDQAALVAEVMGVLEHPDFARVFGPGSRAEAPLAGVVRGRAIAGQIDRLLVAENDVLIVDFKTRRPVPPSVERTPTAYLRQMAAYRALVAEIWPERRTSCALLWTDGPRLIPLPAALLDACAP
jgi:ATP-dependent helicase/nuclease subunit A